MSRDIKYYSVVGLSGRILYIFKVPSGDLQTVQQAEYIAEKAKSALKGGDYVPDVVVMEGEPNGNPKLFGSRPSVSYIRSILPSMPNNVWHPAILD
jgi:hypothetical protein